MYKPGQCRWGEYMGLYVHKETRELLLKDLSIHDVKKLVDMDLSKLRAVVLNNILSAKGIEIDADKVVMIHVAIGQGAVQRITFDIVYDNGKRDVLQFVGDSSYTMVRLHRFELFNGDK